MLITAWADPAGSPVLPNGSVKVCLNRAVQAAWLIRAPESLP
jgi:hypothetical protein